MNLCKARIWAAHRHGQQLYANKPYSFHLQQVEAVLRRFGINDEDLLISCHTHDLKEDADVCDEELRQVGFSERVIRITNALTDQPGNNRSERKKKTLPLIAKEEDFVIVKLADRIANAEYGEKILMYQKEYPDFRKVLFNSSHALAAPIWAYLDELMAYQK